MERVTADFLLPLASRYQPIHAKELVDSGSIESFSVGTGPMIMEDAVQGHHVAFAKEPHYGERDVLLDGVRFEFVPDDDTRLALFREGRFDYAYSLIARYEELDSLLDTNPHAQINLRVVDSGTMPLGLNLSNPKFADERIRRAIALAPDPSLMADRVYDNLARVLPLHPWIFTRDEMPYVELGDMGAWFGRHDPDQATQLLRAAGAEDLAFDSIYHNDGDAGAGPTSRTWRSNSSPPSASPCTRGMSISADSTRSGCRATSRRPAPRRGGRRASTPITSSTTWSTRSLRRTSGDSTTRRSTRGRKRSRSNSIPTHDATSTGRCPATSSTRCTGRRSLPPWVSRSTSRGCAGVRFGGILGTNSSYYDWGDQIAGAWIDDRIPGRQT